MFTKPPAALVTTFGFFGGAANQSERSTPPLYTVEELSLKYNVTSPFISTPPFELLCVEKPRIAMLG
jgi:hypothetical protein